MCAGNKMKTEWMEERQKRKCRFAKRKGQAAAAAAIHGRQLGIKKKKKGTVIPCIVVLVLLRLLLLA